VTQLVALDLTDDETCHVLGVRRGNLHEDDLTGDDYTTCQEIADRARAAGFDGILAPSAALEGEFTVVVFTHAMHKVTEENSRVQHPPRTMRRLARHIRRVL